MSIVHCLSVKNVVCLPAAVVVPDILLGFREPYTQSEHTETLSYRDYSSFADLSLKEKFK